MTSATVVLLANPASGRGRSLAAAHSMAERLQILGVSTQLVCGTSAGDAQAQLADVVFESKPAAVVACGGDGTVSMALQAVAGTSTALGMLPVGTGNDNATAFGVPADPRAGADLVADVLRTQAFVEVDAGRVTSSDGVTRWFLGVLSSGFDSCVNERANAMTWPTGQARYVAAIVGELRVFRAVPYSLVIDAGLPSESRIDKPGMLVAVANGPQYGGGMKVAPAARMNDGQLDVIFLDELSTPTFLRVFPSVYAGTHIRRPEVHQLKASTISIDAPGQTVYADGERVGPLPAQIEIVPRTVRVLTRPLP